MGQLAPVELQLDNRILVSLNKQGDLSIMSFDLEVSPSTLEVDFDKNLTELYKAITDQSWDDAIAICKRDPMQAATWVVRHYDEEEDTEEQEIMWRFLPIHSACARHPPAAVVDALIKAYPDGPKCIDDQGMYALHYACGNQASQDVIRSLLVCCPEATRIRDPRGMLPIHYLACWGPSSVAVVDMILVAHRGVINARDDEGKTPLDLAEESEYPQRDDVIVVLKRWMVDDTSVISEETSKRSIDNSSNMISPLSTKLSHAQSSITMSHRPSMMSALSHRTYDEEEKKEEDSVVSGLSKITKHTTATNGTQKSTYSAATEASKLSAMVLQKEKEVSALKAKLAEQAILLKRESKAPWEMETKTWKERFEALLDHHQKVLSETQSANAELEKKNNELMFMRETLAETQGKLLRSEQECDGLRDTLGDLMDQHEAFKKRSGAVNGRLGSLTATLESMVENQSIIQETLTSKSTSLSEKYETRKKLLQELLQMEESLQKDEEILEQALMKQSRELGAISAIINATRD
ncbi:hypothetical protein FisN_4Lh229 [Fistulifera solaris]|uniref:Uncharacterized protein n=1 Tax=Fistulifera solaris TaxID=1519565 RepID=A0A1Z5JZA4_FISSO|nr:hypothetical protein FisN_4Lh229 [Fistulifera solaris]|eukprot:GAX19186.1 hypothetical protein FisN_4Lh229 [Fistulifera solaris]